MTPCYRPLKMGKLSRSTISQYDLNSSHVRLIFIQYSFRYMLKFVSFPFLERRPYVQRKTNHRKF